MNPALEQRAPRLMVVAGEASGDQIAALAVRELLALRPDCEVYGVGGSALAAAGMRVEIPAERLAVMGLWDVLRNLRALRGDLGGIRRLARGTRPDVLLLVDAPGLNMTLARSLQDLRQQGMSIVYYISPKYWAWRRGRLKTVAALSDRQALIFPFEEADYRRAGGEPLFVGHPVFDLVAGRPTRAQARTQLSLDAGERVIALLPGSRLGELRRHLPLLADCAALLADQGARLLLQVPDHLPPAILDPLVATVHGPRIVRGQYHEVLAAADLALVASGTASLEAAVHGLPHHVFYRMDPLALFLARWLVRVPWASPVNLVAGEELVPESIGADARPVRLANWAATRLLNPADLREQGRRLRSRMEQALGGAGASARVARLLAELLDSGAER
jgi:lipid-A-disaccharide synthase